MAEKRLRFRAVIEGKEAGVVAAIVPPVDVPEYFGTRGRVAIRGTIKWICVSLVADADGRLPHDAGQ
ncbi:MAG TPA: hypothetical protein VGG04_05215 [Candidatus Sulfotelmatobacter sp.]